ncbi:carboxyltransferase domain-containing protein [Alcanivorax sp.]|uniref:carboxyltransferase domain-containing protein n=1 Tax=Alcanivorax sp. TaxID=1872427 RepID=UPI0039E3D42A
MQATRLQCAECGEEIAFTHRVIAARIHGCNVGIRRLGIAPVGKQYFRRLDVPLAGVGRAVSQPAVGLHRQVHAAHGQGHLGETNAFFTVQGRPVNRAQTGQGFMLKHGATTVVSIYGHQTGKIPAQFQPGNLGVIAPITVRGHDLQLLIRRHEITLQNQFPGHQQAQFVVIRLGFQPGLHIAERHRVQPRTTQGRRQVPREHHPAHHPDKNQKGK